MTATYGEVGLSYAAINWSYDGSELNTGPYAPTVFLDAEGPLAALVHIGSLARLAKTGTLAALQHVGVLVEPVQARPAGQLRNYTARGTLLTYTKTGTLE